MTIAERQLAMLRQVFRPLPVEPPDRVALRERVQRQLEYAERRARELAPLPATAAEKQAAYKVYRKAREKNEIPLAERCELCRQSDQRLYGHHTDYSKPLLVAWVCGGCHSFIHLTARADARRAAQH